MQRKNHLLKPALQTLLLAALSCCTSLDSVKEFATASRTISDAASKGYKDFDDFRVEAERDTKIIKGQVVTPDDLARLFEGTVEGSRRIAALRALAGYASALEELASKDSTPEIKAAAMDIKGSLTSLNTNLQAVGKGSVLSASEISGISAVFAATAYVYVDYKREIALREIIQMAHPGVKKAADILHDEFRDMAHVLRTIFRNSSQRTLEALNAKDANGAFVLGMDARRKLGTLAQGLEDNVVRAPAACNAVAEAASQMGEAHVALNVAAAKGGSLNTKESLDAARLLFSKAKDVRELFNDVRKPAP